MLSHSRFQPFSLAVLFQDFKPLFGLIYIITLPFCLSVWMFVCLSVCLFVCLSVCLFVCLYPIHVKTAEPIRPKCFVGPHMIPGKVYTNSQNFKNLYPKICIQKSVSKNLYPKDFEFCKILKMRVLNIIKSANFFFVIVLYSTKRRCLQKATIKSWNRG